MFSYFSCNCCFCVKQIQEFIKRSARAHTNSFLSSFWRFFSLFLQVDDRLTLAQRNERLQNQLRSLKDELKDETVESGETTMDRIHKENVKQGRDKYKTLREVRKGNTKRRVDQFENM